MRKGSYIIVAILIIFFGTIINYSLVNKDKLEDHNSRSYNTGVGGGYIGGGFSGGHK